MTLRTPLTLLAVLSLAACGGSPPPAQPPKGGHEHGPGHGPGHGHGHGRGKEHGKEHHDHDKLAPPLKEFHAVLSPLWHADKGPARNDQICAQAKTLEDKAAATKDDELSKATHAVSEACAKEGRPKLEELFVVVHERFHVLAK